VWHDSCIRVTWLMHTCDMTHAYMWHESQGCKLVPGIHRDMTNTNTNRHTLQKDLPTLPAYTHIHRDMAHSFMTWLNQTTHLHGSWLIHTCDMTHVYVWHDSFIRVTWLIGLKTSSTPHSHVWHDSLTYVTWLIHTCDMTHSYVWHESFIRVTWLAKNIVHASLTCVTWLT